MTNNPDHLDISRLKIQDKALRQANSVSYMSYFFWAIALGFLGVVCFRAGQLSEHEDEKTKLSEQSQTNRKSISSSTENLTTSPQIPTSTQVSSRPVTLAATGYVVAQRKAAVSSKATGRLRELSVSEGDLVKKDQIIGVIENDDLQAISLQADESIKAAEAQIQAAQADLNDVERQSARTKQLAKQKVVAQADFDTVEARLERARANLQLAQANLLVSKAQAEKARVELDYTLIRAPFDGTVLDKNADIGEIVAPFGSATDARAAIVTIADMTSLEVEADVSESNISKVKVGQEAKIVLDSYPEHSYRGKVKSIVPTVDRAKATVMVRIQFTSLDERVLPEMSAKVEFQIDQDIEKDKL